MLEQIFLREKKKLHLARLLVLSVENCMNVICCINSDMFISASLMNYYTIKTTAFTDKITVEIKSNYIDIVLPATCTSFELLEYILARIYTAVCSVISPKQCFHWEDAMLNRA